MANSQISDPHDAHPAPHDEVRRAKKKFLIVGMMLFFFTCSTVAVATVPWLDVGDHGFDKWDAVLGLLIASTKALLVAFVFMHLSHEKKLIYFIIGIGLVHAAGLYIGTHFHFADMVHDSHFFQNDKAKTGDAGTDLIETRPGSSVAPPDEPQGQQ